MNDDEARTQARKRLEDQRGFWNFFVVFLLVSALLIGIWAINDSGHFWPAYPIAGMAIGLALSGWNAYGRKPISEADVDRELERQRGS